MNQITNSVRSFSRVAGRRWAIALAMSAVAIAGTALTLISGTECAHASRCGECYNTGKAGIRTGSDGMWCTPCEQAQPDRTLP